MRLETLKCVFEACVSEFYSVAQNAISKIAFINLNVFTPMTSVVVAQETQFSK